MQRQSLVLATSIAISLCGSAFGQSANRTIPHRFQPKSVPAIVHGSQSSVERKTMVAAPAPAGAKRLPVWNYEVISSRDSNLYEGIIVGRDPNNTGTDASVSIPAQIVPVILKFHTIGTAVDLSSGIISTKSGSRSSNPTVADTGCFTGSNNIPLKLMSQSPVLQNANFNFGGTHVDFGQYGDAFQRGAFWQVIDKNNYHVRLTPQVLAPLIVDVPAATGLSLNKNVFEPYFSMCSPEGIVDINFLDAVATKAVTSTPGINPGTFPMFMIYNTGMSIGDPTDLNNCCAGGYHGINPAGPLAFQTYSPFDFDVSGFFVPSANDTAIVSHEVAEWVNDPYAVNSTPAWGHTGQVGGCQNNLEVGDPLTGTEAPRIVGSNGFTYHLQELAFFSWFFGSPSLGIHGWYSNNGTFLSDAGPVCQ